MYRVFYSEQGDSWGKLGYVLHGDSTSFRDVLDDNPGWDLTHIPAPGSVLRTKVTESTLDTAGTISGVDFTIEPSGFRDSKSETDPYPWPSEEELVERLMSYSPSSIEGHFEVNSGYN